MGEEKGARRVPGKACQDLILSRIADDPEGRSHPEASRSEEAGDGLPEPQTIGKGPEEGGVKGQIEGEECEPSEGQRGRNMAILFHAHGDPPDADEIGRKTEEKPFSEALSSGAGNDQEERQKEQGDHRKIGDIEGVRIEEGAKPSSRPQEDQNAKVPGEAFSAGRDCRCGGGQGRHGASNVSRARSL